MTDVPRSKLGATYLGENRTQFVVWAPAAERVELRLVELGRTLAMEAVGRGYHEIVADGVAPGARYRFALDGAVERPDPASRSQPDGVHGPSQVVDPHFGWTDAAWFGPALEDYVIYELHVGTFTAEGTFDAIIPHLRRLRDLGVTAIELMPIAEFPGTRNWGYDGVDLFAAHRSYGGPDGLRRLVDAGHAHGLAVVLDVVYNHLGPEGNYLADFGPYFTEKYRTPWGAALNFDGADSDDVRRFFIENALYWIDDCHIDALRLDAVHAIIDDSAAPFLEEIAEAVHRRASRLGRRVFLMPESAANDARLIRPRDLGGYGHDAQWNDDFHHALHALLTGERDGYYRDFGTLGQLGKAYREGYVYTGEYSTYRRRRHGSATTGIPPGRFIVFSQNHDQIGNRMQGDRLAASLSFRKQKLAAVATLLSPFVPLIFMGEEYGEIAPFQYFVSHTDEALVEAVRKGRREEFAAFGWDETEVPDPQDAETFARCKLNHSLRHEGWHRALYDLYGELLRLRRSHPALGCGPGVGCDALALEGAGVLFLRKTTDDGRAEACVVLNFSGTPSTAAVPLPAGRWRPLLDGSDGRWYGDGTAPSPSVIESDGEVTLTIGPHSFAVYGREE